jgi:hypothetical protein
MKKNIKAIDEDSAKMLLDMIDLSRKDAGMKTCFSEGQANEFRKTLTLEPPKLDLNQVTDKSIKNSLLHAAIYAQDTQVTDFLLSEGANANARNINNITPLGSAIRAYELTKNEHKTYDVGRDDTNGAMLIKMLLKHSSAKTIKEVDGEKNSALHNLSIIKGVDTDLISTTLDRVKELEPDNSLGDFVSLGNKKGYTAFNMLMNNGNIDASKTILDKLTPQEGLDSLFMATSFVSKVGKTMSSILFAKDENTYKWFESKFQELEEGVVNEREASSNRADENALKLIAEIEEENKKEALKSSKRKSKKKSKNKDSYKESEVSNNGDVKGESNNKGDIVFSPGKPDFEKKVEEFLVSRLTNLLKENEVDPKEFDTKMKKNGLFVIPPKSRVDKTGGYVGMLNEEAAQRVNASSKSI